MEQKKINRINELARKQKSVGLTKEEKVEQTELRKEYLSLIRKNFKNTMDNVSIKEKDGSITHLKRKLMS
ncbi:MAG: DUF896 domain-containing protein [Eubacteriales bacterium]